MYNRAAACRHFDCRSQSHHGVSRHNQVCLRYFPNEFHFLFNARRRSHSRFVCAVQIVHVQRRCCLCSVETVQNIVCSIEGTVHVRVPTPARGLCRRQLPGQWARKHHVRNVLGQSDQLCNERSRMPILAGIGYIAIFYLMLTSLSNQRHYSEFETLRHGLHVEN